MQGKNFFLQLIKAKCSLLEFKKKSQHDFVTYGSVNLLLALD